MRRNSNYFGDLSQFLLKAKKQENFVLDPKIKESIREKLSLKINEIKNPAVAAEQPVAKQPAVKETIYEAPKSGGFWTLWKRQLISVPASLFALMMIVFAANDFNFSMQPKEDYSPKTGKSTTETALDLQTTLLDTNITEAPVLIAESDRQIKKPEPLVLDINTMGATGETRTLNKYQPSENTTGHTTETTAANTQQTQTTQVQSAPTETQKTTDTSASQQTNTFTLQTNTSSQSTDINSGSTADTASTAETASAETDAATTTSTSASTTASSTTQQTQEQIIAASQPEEESPAIITASNTPAETTNPNAPTYTLNLNTTPVQQELNVIAEDPLSEATIATIDSLVQTSAVNIVNSGALTIESVPLKDYIKDAGIFIKTVRSKTYSVNYYKDPAITFEPVFDKSIITEITYGKSPSAVNVYYISDTQVLVEIVEGTTKKLYLYEKKGDSWTVIKYEQK